MATPLALTALNGLLTQTQAEIFDQLAAKMVAQFGPSLNVSTSSLMGQLLNVVAEGRAADQQALLDVYRSFDPNAAQGPALDARAALTGSVRRGESFSQVSGFVTFTGAGLLPAGALIEHAGTGTQWALLSAVNAPGAGSYSAVFRATAAGPSTAFAGTVWDTITVVANYIGFNNLIDDASLGALTEGDPAFRLRRAVEIFSQNTGPLAAIESAVSKVSTASGSVVSVRAYDNPKISPADSNGIPYKAFNVVVETSPPLPLPQTVGPINPLAQEIANAIFSATGAGGQAYGTDYGVVQPMTVIDSEGQAQDGGGFDVVARVDIYIDVDITLETAPEDGPVIPEQPDSMASLVRRQVATVAAARFTQLGRNARALDHSGTIQTLVNTGQLGGIASATVGVTKSPPALLAPPVATLTADISIRERADYNTGAVRVFVDGVLY